MIGIGRAINRQYRPVKCRSDMQQAGIITDHGSCRCNQRHCLVQAGFTRQLFHLRCFSNGIIIIIIIIIINMFIIIITTTTTIILHPKPSSHEGCRG